MRKIKDRWIGTRVDEDYYAEVENYTDATGLNNGELLRAAITEYINNHPPKQVKKPTFGHLKPGKE